MIKSSIFGTLSFKIPGKLYDYWQNVLAVQKKAIQALPKIGHLSNGGQIFQPETIFELRGDKYCFYCLFAYKTITIRNEEYSVVISLKSSRRHSRLRGVHNFMRNVKKTVILVLCLAIVYAVLRKTYRFLSHYESAYFSSPSVSNEKKSEKSVDQAELLPKYNFQRMLKLIKDSEKLKETFYAQYAGFKTKIKPIDIKATKALLADLYREKMRLTKYQHEIKLHYKGNVPVKKSKTLMYYQKVIEQYALDVAEILRKA